MKRKITLYLISCLALLISCEKEEEKDEVVIEPVVECAQHEIDLSTLKITHTDSYIVNIIDGEITIEGTDAGENEYVRLELPEAIDVSENPKIFISSSKSATTSVDCVYALGIEDVNQYLTANSKLDGTDLGEQIITVGEEFSVHYVDVTDKAYHQWNAINPNVEVDLTKIKSIFIQPNSTYASYPYDDANGNKIDSPMNGEITINRIYFNDDYCE